MQVQCMPLQPAAFGYSVIGCILSAMPDVTVCCFMPRGHVSYVIVCHGRRDKVGAGGGERLWQREGNMQMLPLCLL